MGYAYPNVVNNMMTREQLKRCFNVQAEFKKQWKLNRNEYLRESDDFFSNSLGIQFKIKSVSYPSYYMIQRGRMRVNANILNEKHSPQTVVVWQFSDGKWMYALRREIVDNMIGGIDYTDFMTSDRPDLEFRTQILKDFDFKRFQSPPK